MFFLFFLFTLRFLTAASSLFSMQAAVFSLYPPCSPESPDDGFLPGTIRAGARSEVARLAHEGNILQRVLPTLIERLDVFHGRPRVVVGFFALGSIECHSSTAVPAAVTVPLPDELDDQFVIQFAA